MSADPEPPTLVRGATVVDGTGAPARPADVVFAADRIVAVTDPESVDARGHVVVDGRGRVLAPGFIDTHTHDDFAALIHPDMGFKVLGGVTTCIVGNCGMGAAPHRWAVPMGRSFHPDLEVEPWEGYAGYLDRIDAVGPAVNVAALIGHGTVRAGAMGFEDRQATDTELDAMRAAVSEGMTAGCVGMSSGLIYPPGSWAGTDELVALAEVVAGHGGVYTSHIRDEGDHLLEAVDEAIEIGRRSGAAVVISHLKARGRANFGKVTDALARIDVAGPTVAADQYPYAAASTVLSAAVESSGVDGPELDRLVIASTSDHPEWHGRSLAQLGEDLGVDDPVGVVLAAEPTTTVVMHVMDEGDVRTVLAHPGVMVGSDGVPTLHGHPHPRLYGTFARVLGRYVRELGILSLEAAIHRMTGRSAAVFGLADRGEIRPGAFADLVLFDAAEILDVGTYDDPHHPPVGIDGVWVNGVRVVAAGRHLGTRPGVAIRR